MLNTANRYRAWATLACALIFLGITTAPAAGSPEDPAAATTTHSRQTGTIAGGVTSWEGPQASFEEPMALEGQLRIAGSVLRPRSSNPTFSSITPGCIYAEADAYEVWNAPVYLPQGATVDQMRFYFFDGSVSSNSIAWFTVYDYQGSVADEWSVQSFGNSGTGYANTGTIGHVIDYAVYSYVVNWRPQDLGSTMQVCGFRIYYTMP